MIFWILATAGNVAGLVLSHDKTWLFSCGLTAGFAFDSWASRSTLADVEQLAIKKYNEGYDDAARQFSPPEPMRKEASPLARSIVGEDRPWRPGRTK